MKHTSVLLEESIATLQIKPEGIYVDATLGRGGHSKQILEQLTTGHLYGIDKDEEAIRTSDSLLKAVSSSYTLIHDDFKKLKIRLEELGVYKIDGILFDLGVSSPQFDDPERGFSYRFDARLDMRMDQRQDKTAYDVVNFYSFEDLARIFREYGEEPHAKYIARAIEKARMTQPITTTFELVEIIKSALPQKVLKKKGHPAKQVFQSLRLEVNQELEQLDEVLRQAAKMLKVDGCMAVISFHSLEDRIVKRVFQSLTTAEQVDKRIPLLATAIAKPKYELVSRKPVVANEEELGSNPRAKSAKLRGIKRLEE